MKTKTFTITLFLLFLTPFLFAQKALEHGNVEYMDVVYLKDGSVFKGHITEWDQGNQLQIRILGGVELTFSDSVIKKVRQQFLSPRNFRSPYKKTYQFREEGLYNTLSFSFVMGSELGFSLTYSIGHRFNRLLGVGVGIGIEDLEIDFASQIVPVFGEVRGYLSPKKRSAYYAMRLGYGFGIKNENWNVTKADGGIMINPEIGFRFGGSEDVNFYLGTGYRFQKSKYTREFPWNERVEVDKLTFKRLDLRFGIDF